MLLVTDQVIRGTGLVEKVEAGVADGGLEVVGVFDDVPQDSDTAVVMRCAEQAKDQGADSFLAVGGGSVIDTTKAANVIFSHGGTIPEWEGVFGLPRERDGMGRPLPLAPLGAIPTTAGTGSEASPVAVIKDSERGIKFVILDFPLAPDLAILDPESTATLPAPIAAATGMDALTHAIEGVTSTEWSPHGDAYALQAIRLIRDNLERAVADTSDEEARGQHAGRREPGDRADRLRRDRHHPLDVAPLRGPLRRSARGRQRDQPAAGDRVQRRGQRTRWRTSSAAPPSCSGSMPRGGGEQVGRALADHVRELRARLGLPGRLSEVGVPEQGIPQLAEDAMGEGSTLVNPREPTAEDFVELFHQAL